MSGYSLNNSNHHYSTITTPYVAPPPPITSNTNAAKYDHRRQPIVIAAPLPQNHPSQNLLQEHYATPLPFIVSASIQQSFDCPSSFSSAATAHRPSASQVDGAPLIQQLPQLENIELCPTPNNGQSSATQFNGAISSSSSSLNPSQSTFPASTSTFPVADITDLRPHHGNNVHAEGLSGLTKYALYQGSKLPASRYTHDPYAQRYTMRASCLPFEREATMVSDMQTVLNTICPQSVIVESARKALKGHDIEFILRITTNPKQLAEILNDAVVLMDRHGFHYIADEAQLASEMAVQSPPAYPTQYRQNGRNNRPQPSTRREQLKGWVTAYCQHIRRMPQPEYRWYLDGLPSSIVRFQLELAR